MSSACSRILCHTSLGSRDTLCNPRLTSSSKVILFWDHQRRSMKHLNSLSYSPVSRNTVLWPESKPFRNLDNLVAGLQRLLQSRAPASSNADTNLAFRSPPGSGLCSAGQYRMYFDACSSDTSGSTACLQINVRGGKLESLHGVGKSIAPVGLMVYDELWSKVRLMSMNRVSNRTKS